MIFCNKTLPVCRYRYTIYYANYVKRITGTVINKKICMIENPIFKLKTKNILKNGW